MTKDLTKGSPIKQVLIFALPFFIGNVFQQLYNMADSIIVGQTLGENALGGVGSTGSLVFFVMGFVQGLATGLAIKTGQLFGAKDYGGVKKSIATSFVIAMVIGGLMTALSIGLARTMLVVLRTPQAQIEHAYSYVIPIFIGTLATMFYNFLASVLRSLGDSRTPLYFLILSVVLNVGLDFLFIKAFLMGTAGAGWATVLAQVISGVCCLVYALIKFPLMRMKFVDFAFGKRKNKETVATLSQEESERLSQDGSKQIPFFAEVDLIDSETSRLETNAEMSHFENGSETFCLNGDKVAAQDRVTPPKLIKKVTLLRFYIQHLILGLPTALQFSIIAIGIIVQQSAINGLGAQYTIAFAAASKIDNVMMQFMVALGAALAAFVAQNYGAGLIERVKRTVNWCALINVVGAFVSFGINCLIAEIAMSLFLKDPSPQVLSIAKQYLFYQGVFYCIVSSIFVYRNALQGLGLSLFTVIGGIIEVAARIAGAIGLCGAFGFAGLCYSNPLAWLGGGLFFVISYYTVIFVWKKRKNINMRLTNESTKSII